MSRRVSVFFYGLFMDAEALRARGLQPTNVRAAAVSGFALRIGERATLVEDTSSTVHGMLMELTHDDIDALYADPSVNAYRPEPVLAVPAAELPVPALCFNLVTPPVGGAGNSEYADKLRTVARRLRLPRAYVDSIC